MHKNYFFLFCCLHTPSFSQFLLLPSGERNYKNNVTSRSVTVFCSSTSSVSRWTSSIWMVCVTSLGGCSAGTTAPGWMAGLAADFTVNVHSLTACPAAFLAMQRNRPCVIRRYISKSSLTLGHEFCSRNAPQYGVPNRAISVARSLSRQPGERIVSM